MLERLRRETLDVLEHHAHTVDTNEHPRRLLSAC